MERDEVSLGLSKGRVFLHDRFIISTSCSHPSYRSLMSIWCLVQSRQCPNSRSPDHLTREGSFSVETASARPKDTFVLIKVRFWKPQNMLSRKPGEFMKHTAVAERRLSDTATTGEGDDLAWEKLLISNHSWSEFVRELTVDPFTVIVAQEHDDLGNIVWDSTATERDELGNTSLDSFDRGVLGSAWRVVPCVLGEHVGLDTTGGNGVGGDAAGSTISGERASETLDSRLGTSVQSVVGNTNSGSDG